MYCCRWLLIFTLRGEIYLRTLAVPKVYNMLWSVYNMFLNWIWTADNRLHLFLLCSSSLGRWLLMQGFWRWRVCSLCYWIHLIFEYLHMVNSMHFGLPATADVYIERLWIKQWLPQSNTDSLWIEQWLPPMPLQRVCGLSIHRRGQLRWLGLLIQQGVC